MKHRCALVLGRADAGRLDVEKEAPEFNVVLINETCEVNIQAGVLQQLFNVYDHAPCLLGGGLFNSFTDTPSEADV